MSMHDDPASLGFATLVAAEPGADSLERFALIAHGLGLPVLRVQASNTHTNLRDAQAFPRFPPPMIRGLVLVDISSLDDDSRASQLWHRYLDETNTRGSGDDYTRVVFVDQSGRDPWRHSAISSTVAPICSEGSRKRMSPWLSTQRHPLDRAPACNGQPGRLCYHGSFQR